jgi:ADP-ribose pyrophosphatase YjhB (NUDIX family)
MTAANDVRAVETWRILLVRRSGDEILLGYEATKFTLPQVGIPIHERIAANINRAVERQLRLNVISLYEIVYQDQEPSNGVFYHALALAQPSQATPKDTSWTAMRSLVRSSFAREEDFLAIDAFRMGLEAGKQDRITEPFLKPSWFAEVASWVQDSLRPHSLNLTLPSV